MRNERERERGREKQGLDSKYLPVFSSREDPS